jgi:acid phosphatase type 7
MKPLISFLWVLLLAAGVNAQSSSNTKATATEDEASAGSIAVLVGAGDIASCDDLKGAEATANLLDRIPGTVFAVGDLAYPDGSDEQFAKCYGRTKMQVAISNDSHARKRTLV